MKIKSTLFILVLVFMSFVSFSQNTESDKTLNTFHSISSTELLEFATELSSEK